MVYSLITKSKSGSESNMPNIRLVNLKINHLYAVLYKQLTKKLPKEIINYIHYHSLLTLRLD